MRYGIIVDLMAALEMMFSGGAGGAPSLDAINPVSIIEMAYKRHGINIIELPGDAHFIMPNLLTDEKNVKGLQDLRDEHKLEYTVHLPFMQLHLCSMNNHIRQASINSILEAIRVSENLGGINNYVLHLTSELEDQIGSFDVPRHYKELAWGLFLDKGMVSLEEIIAKSELDPAKICVENNEGIPFSDVYDILLDELDLSICLDVGHAVLQEDETPLDIMKKWKDRVHEIHLHNVRTTRLANRVRIREDHRGIYPGVIDMVAFLNHLESMAFNHPVLLEVMTQEEIAESLDYLRAQGFL